MQNNIQAFGTISIVLLGAISFGTVTSFPGPAIMSLKNQYPQIAEERFQDLLSWFSNLPRISAGIGPFLIIGILPKIGRKNMLIIIAFFLATCWFLLLLIEMKDEKNDVPFNLYYGIIIRTIMGFFGERCLFYH